MSLQVTTASSSSQALVTVNVEDLLCFFDEKPDWSKRHATGIVGIAGEDLNGACFQHYMESRNASATVLRAPGSSRPLPVGPGTLKGPHLDRWIRVDWSDGSTTIFQAEIKNWSAHAIGGKTLSLNASLEEVADYKQARWERHWDSQNRRLKGSLTSKVLTRMKLPSSVDDKDSVRPLLIFWEAVGPKDRADDHLFNVAVADGEFQELWVFSVSSYLRSLKDATLELEMPDAAHRVQALDRLFSV